MDGDEKGKDQIKAVSFAAGTAAFLACIERAVLVSVFVHWRVWAFLALNLLLLAILFTSKSQIPSKNEIDPKDGGSSEFKKKKVHHQECNHHLVSTTNGVGCGETTNSPKHGDHVKYEAREVEEGDGEKKECDELSKEELNKRVEAFIVRFRQHLVSDANGDKSHRLNYLAEASVYV